MNDADRAQQLIEEEARIDRMVEAWQAMYAEWEFGRAASPSAEDLANEAHAQHPERFPYERIEELAEGIYERLCDAWMLTNVATEMFEQFQ